MDTAEVQSRMLALGLRIEPKMSEYVLQQLRLRRNSPATFAVMGGDARTGMPVRRFISPAAFDVQPTPTPPTQQP